MILIKFALFLLVLCSCAKALRNLYNTPPLKYDEEEFVLVNGCRGYEHNYLLKDGTRVFNFPESRILLVDIKDFDMTQSDSFFINKEHFHSTPKYKNYQLFLRGSINAGYSCENFDFIYFTVVKKGYVSPDTTNYLVNSDYVIQYLRKNKIESTKPSIGSCN